jgi:hypothetical protein
MKKIILFSAMAASCLMSHAQVMLGIQAGGNAASVKQGIPTASVKSDTRTGVIVGVFSDIDMGKTVSFHPEFNFIQKGGENAMTYLNSYGNSTTVGENNFKFSYLELAPNFLYKIQAGKGKLFLGLGPDLSFGITGKYKESSTTTGTGGIIDSYAATKSTKVEFDGKENTTDDRVHLKRFDLGANFTAGYKMTNGIFISAGYTLGLLNIDPNEKYSVKNRGFFLKLGYLLNQKDLGPLVY